jgi:hypothetical protein
MPVSRSQGANHSILRLESSFLPIKQEGRKFALLLGRRKGLTRRVSRRTEEDRTRGV